MNVAEKVRMAHQLDRLGVDIIEAGFPIASEGDFEAVRLLSRETRRPVLARLAPRRRYACCPERSAVPSAQLWRAVVGATSSAPGKPWKALPVPAFTPFWP